jgi:PPP family 3-phenylpropionic acid transporter
MTRLSFSLSLSLFYAALFSAFGVYMPFIPVWLAAKGLGPQEISLCMAMAMSLRLLVPFWGFAADRLRNQRLVLAFCLGAAILAGLVLTSVTGFWTIFTLMLLLSLFWTPTAPLTEGFAVVESAKRGADYGRVRVWGSASFIAANMAAGWMLDQMDALWILPLMLMCMTVALAAIGLLPPDSRRMDGVARAKVGDALGLLRQSHILLFMLAAGLVQASHGLYYSFSSVHWQVQGFSTSLIGSLWAVGVIAETLLFAVATRVTGYASPQALVLAGGMIAGLRWTLMAFDPPAHALFVLQVMHAGSFAVTHMGTMKFIHQNVPPALAATGQGVFTALSAGVLTALAMFASGPLYASFGGMAYLAMAGMCAASLVLVLSPRVRVQPVA